MTQGYSADQGQWQSSAANGRPLHDTHTGLTNKLLTHASDLGVHMQGAGYTAAHGTLHNAHQSGLKVGQSYNDLLDALHSTGTKTDASDLDVQSQISKVSQNWT
jgi:hypothetical protein